MQRLRSILLLVGVLVLAACSWNISGAPQPDHLPTQLPEEAPAAAEQATGSETLPQDPAVTIGRFDNGFTYYIRRNIEPRERAELWLVVHAGSMQEDEDQLGLAHFVEHMAFNGTEHFARQELVDYLESIGMRFGPDLNAFTSFDRTVYLLKIPTDTPEILDNAFLILRDWAAGLALQDDEIDKERGVVVEEWRLGRGADARMRDRQLPIILQGSRYAERLPIGKKEILENAPYDTLRRFYRDWYRPDLMALIAIGDLDPDTIKPLIAKHFATLPSTAEPRTKPEASVPGHRQTLLAAATDPEATQTEVGIYYKHPPTSQTTRDDYERSLLEGLYHQMLNERLVELARKADPPFLFGASTPVSFVPSRDDYLQYAAVEPGEIERGLRTLLIEARRVAVHGFSSTELERAKENLLRSFERAYEERDKRSSDSFASEYMRNYLESEPSPGIEYEYDLAGEFVPTVTPEDVNRLASRFITEENRVILINAPEKHAGSIPPQSALLDVFKEVQQATVDPFVDDVRDAPLMAIFPEPAEVVDEAFIPEIGVTSWRLSNGVRIFLKPTDFKNDQILLSGYSPGGHSLVDDPQYTSAILAQTLVAIGGLGDFDQHQLRKALAGKALSANLSIGELEEGLQAGASPQDFETMLQVIYLKMTSPRKDEEAFNTLLTQFRAALANRLDDPGTVFQDRMAEVLSQGHWRRRPMTLERLDEVNLDTAFETFEDRFADAGDFTFVLVGNFDLEWVRPLVLTYLGGLPSHGREESWRDIGIEPPQGIQRFEVARGVEPKSQVSLVITGEAEFSRQRVHELQTLAAVMRIRLRKILREDLAATYGVNVLGALSSRPRQTYTLTVAFGCAPENVDSLVDTLLEDLAHLRTEGINPQHLETVREQQIRGREISLRKNGFWLGALENYDTHGWDLREILKFDELVHSTTAESLQQAARRYVNLDRYVLGVLRPAESQEASETSAQP